MRCLESGAHRSRSTVRQFDLQDSWWWRFCRTRNSRVRWFWGQRILAVSAESRAFLDPFDLAIPWASTCTLGLAQPNRRRLLMACR